MKKCSRLCKDTETHDWESRVTYDWQAANYSTRVKRAKKMNRQASWSTTGQKVQSGRSVNSWLELETQSSREAKPPASSVLEKLASINTPHTHEILRASRENFERETLEKNKIDSSTIFT